MIEIKFKAWNYNEKTMHHIVTGIEWLEQGVFVLADGVRGQFGPVILLQYTGLHDRNGKEIYEGDIVDFTQEQGEIFFENGRYMFRQTRAHSSLSIGDDSPSFFGNPDYSEIVGNRYENPNLIERSA